MGHPKSDWGPTRDPKRKAEAFKALRQEQLSGMEKYINLQIPILLGAWQDQVNSAITDAPYPSQEESRVYWYVALGGNLLWALTCFIDPASAAVPIMSLSGAAVGSGGIQWWLGESPPVRPPDVESAKTLVRGQVAKARGQLERYFQNKRRELASGFSRLQDWGHADPTTIEFFDAYMWEQMFPWIKFDEDRYEQIRVEALKLMRNTLADYNRQWQYFVQTSAWYGKAIRERYEIAFRPKLNMRFGKRGLESVTRDPSKLDTEYR